MKNAWVINPQSNESALEIDSKIWKELTGIDQLQILEPTAITEFVQQQGKRVLSLLGYANAGYEDPERMRHLVRGALARKDPHRWLINIGATAAGIGAAYELARQQGFVTMGIVSTCALTEKVQLSRYVDYVFFIPDWQWGGTTGGGELSPTSRYYVGTGDEFIAIGGNGITRDEMLAAHQAGKPVAFVAAEMNKLTAQRAAEMRGQTLPSSFSGEAAEALNRFVQS